MNPTTYGPGGINQAGTVIAMVDANGQLTVVSCPPDSTVTVTPLRGASDPETIYCGNIETDALIQIDSHLSDAGAQG
jgi:uncharacterized membrane protein YcaP (DUF421 family)